MKLFSGWWHSSYLEWMDRVVLTWYIVILYSSILYCPSWCYGNFQRRMFRSLKHSLLPWSVGSRHQLVLPVCLHTSPVSSSRIKKVQRHKPLWHIKKLNKAEDAPVTLENRDFIKEVISDQYSGEKPKLLPEFDCGLILRSTETRARSLGPG